MKLKYFLLLIPMFLLACKTDTSNVENANQQSQTTENASSEKINQLIDSFKAQLADNSLDASKKSIISNDLAQLLVGQKQFAAAASTLQNALKTTFDGEGTAKNIGLLASLYTNQLKNAGNAAENLSAFKGYFKDESAMKTQISGLIEAAKNSIYNEESRINPTTAGQYVSLCEMFANVLPGDAQSPTYLFQAGETARSVRNFQKALDIYDWIYDKYPDYEKAPQALFLKAFTLDNDLKQYDKAKELYTSFITKYPKDDFADDTQFLLDNLGKSDDEIIKKFEQ